MTMHTHIFFPIAKCIRCMQLACALFSHRCDCRLLTTTAAVVLVVLYLVLELFCTWIPLGKVLDAHEWGNAKAQMDMEMEIKMHGTNWNPTVHAIPCHRRKRKGFFFLKSPSLFFRRISIRPSYIYRRLSIPIRIDRLASIFKGRRLNARNCHIFELTYLMNLSALVPYPICMHKSTGGVWQTVIKLFSEPYSRLWHLLAPNSNK